MDTIQQIEAQRDSLLQQMRSIRSMERGTINRHFLRVPHKGKKEPALRGPYYVISRRERGKTVGYRLTTAEEIERAKRDVEAHGRFRALCQEFERLTEQLGRMERELSEEGNEKKGLKSRWKKTKK